MDGEEGLSGKKQRAMVCVQRASSESNSNLVLVHAGWNHQNMAQPHALFRCMTHVLAKATHVVDPTAPINCTYSTVYNDHVALSMRHNDSPACHRLGITWLQAPCIETQYHGVAITTVRKADASHLNDHGHVDGYLRACRLHRCS